MTTKTRNEINALLKEASAHGKNATYTDYEGIKRRIPADMLTPDEYTGVIRALCGIMNI